MYSFRCLYIIWNAIATSCNRKEKHNCVDFCSCFCVFFLVVHVQFVSYTHSATGQLHWMHSSSRLSSTLSRLAGLVQAVHLPQNLLLKYLNTTILLRYSPSIHVYYTFTLCVWTLNAFLFALKYTC